MRRETRVRNVILDTVREQYQNTVSPRLDDTLNQFYTCLAGEKCGNAVRCTVSRI